MPTRRPLGFRYPDAQPPACTEPVCKACGRPGSKNERAGPEPASQPQLARVQELPLALLIHELWRNADYLP